MKALAHVMHFAHGGPGRKVPAIVEDLTDDLLTQGAITQHAMTLTVGEIDPWQAALRDQIRMEPVKHTADTGWRIAGKQAFANRALAVYQILYRHWNEKARN